MPDIRLEDYTARISELNQKGRYDEAIAHCRHILNAYPRHYPAYKLMGEACLAKEMYPQARDLFQRSLSADPEDPGAWLGLGRAYIVQRMMEKAIWALERAFELDPGHREIRQALEQVYGQRTRQRTSGPQEPTERPGLTRGALGRLYLRQGFYDKAIGELRAAVQQDTGMPVTHIALAEALWRDGQDLEAAKACLEILKALPNCLKANLILGTIWMRGGNPRPAQKRLDIARVLDPENLVVQKMMGTKSPLPAVEVLFSVSEARKTEPAPGPAASGPRSTAEGKPTWVRELEELEERAREPESS
jgi:tetratricopeptide (TPR) repeat protein